MRSGTTFCRPQVALLTWSTDGRLDASPLNGGHSIQMTFYVEAEHIPVQVIQTKGEIWIYLMVGGGAPPRV